MGVAVEPVGLRFLPRIRADGTLKSHLGSKSNASLSKQLASSYRPSSQPLRYAVLGAGFAGLSVAWHLLQHSSQESSLCIDIYDEVGVGGGASGVAGGLLHPYSPKAKLLWKGAECWKECLKLLSVAEIAHRERTSCRRGRDLEYDCNDVLVWRRGILRPVTALKNVYAFTENAQNCLGSCRLEFLDKDAAQTLVPDLSVPFNSAVYMPHAVTINPKCYLQALFLACQRLADNISASGYQTKEIYLLKKSVDSLLELAGQYSSVIICLGAKTVTLPELSGKLPLRTCRGVVTHLELPNYAGEEYGDHSPSILSDAWFAIQGPRSMILGSTRDWGSRNFSSNVSAKEASAALEELIPKASSIYPAIRKWAFTGARAGVRAVPPLTDLGSVPLMGCVDDTVGENGQCKYWLIGGLGSRGLLYHGWLGKLMAQAVLSCNEDVLPAELTSWKEIKGLKSILFSCWPLPNSDLEIISTDGITSSESYFHGDMSSQTYQSRRRLMSNTDDN